MRNIVEDFDGCITVPRCRDFAIAVVVSGRLRVGTNASGGCQIRKFQVVVLTPESTYVFGGNVNPESSGTKGMNWEKFGRGPSAKVQQ